MNELKIFKNPYFGEIRTVTSELGEPLFVASDVCSALGYSNSRDAVSRHVDSEDRSDVVIHDGSQNRQMTAINESGVYSLVFGSKLETAKAFKKWVTSEVLPVIRKHGAYMTKSTIEKVLTDPDTLIQLAQTLKEERRQKELAQKQLEYQAPLVQYANEVLKSTTGHTSTTIGSELNMSAVVLNEFLVIAEFYRQTGTKKCREYSLRSKYLGRGYITTNTVPIIHRDGTEGTRIQTLITEAGRKKIHELVKRGIEAGVLLERKGRYFINRAWTPKSEEVK